MGSPETYLDIYNQCSRGVSSDIVALQFGMSAMRVEEVLVDMQVPSKRQALLKALELNKRFKELVG